MKTKKAPTPIEIPPQLKNFKNFLYIIWKHLNLPDPTPLQYDLADYMQHGPKRSVIMAFRGVGKSWICSAYVVHQLLLDPALNILVVSASKKQSRRLLHLYPKDHTRHTYPSRTHTKREPTIQ